MSMLPKNSVYWDDVKMSKKGIKKAKICIGCKYNDKGWCTKHISWCSASNHICRQLKSEL